MAISTASILDYRDRLHRITCPVLVVWGNHDQFIPQELGDLLVNAVANGRTLVIGGSCEAPHINDLETWHRELLAFLGEVAEWA